MTDDRRAEMVLDVKNVLIGLISRLAFVLNAAMQQGTEDPTGYVSFESQLALDEECEALMQVFDQYRQP